MVRLTDFRVINYPDGHKHIVSDKDLHGDETLTVRIKSFDDLFLVDQVKEIHPELTCLDVTYLLGARCDRRFSPGEAVDLAIVCKYIRSLGFKHINICKPHSAATKLFFHEAARTYDPTELLLHRIIKDERLEGGVLSNPKLVLVSPDEGASKWVKGLANLAKEVLQCSKVREPGTGRITDVSVPESAWLQSVPAAVIVDDLCDGGATFIQIAGALRDRKPDLRIILAVTHGIFSKGFDVFNGLIDRIYCTNSFQDIDHPMVTQIEVY